MRLSLCSALLVLFPVSAFSQQNHTVELVPAVVVQSVVLNPGKNFDILGVQPGMSFEEAKEALNKSGMQVSDPRQGTLSLQSNGISFQSQSFIISLGGVAITPAEKRTVELSFSSPVSGSRVVAIRYETVYNPPNPMPTGPEIDTQLESKYGKPSDKLQYRETWVFTPVASAKCPEQTCPSVDGIYQVHNKLSYDRSRGMLNDGRSLYIQSTFDWNSSAGTNPSVRRFTLTLQAEKMMALDSDEVQKQLQKVVSSNPPAKPAIKF